ncbi:zinc finger BED domain-containing protein DAYSLEEPER-like [Senna tora]|uniref:Zinc finger BED domain-containing protein DAYSLEEPER-like n=1 Tax=Senna tora TaxID=362788 RepID=A0A834SMC1_9FABA|nr:zinc finger BED domain-containing protein DAYSLEEPER-like [Senna tora]
MVEHPGFVAFFQNLQPQFDMTMVGGRKLHCPYFISSVAMDLLGSAQVVVKKIRNSVKYVRTSESHEEKLMFIDDQTQWNTAISNAGGCFGIEECIFLFGEF